MRRAWRLAALALAVQAGAAEVTSYRRTDGRVSFALDAGEAQIDWLSDSTFRFRRSFAGPLPKQAAPPAPAALEVDDAGRELLFRTRHLAVSVRKRGLAVRVKKSDGTVVFEDLAPAEYAGGVLRLARAAAPEVRLYGLGPRADAGLNARGKTLRAGIPLLVSTAGYGEYFAAPAAHHFDMTPPDRYRVEAHGPALLDYYFMYGPDPKDVFEEMYLSGTEVRVPAAAPVVASWEGLRAALLRTLHGALSGLLEPAFDAAAFDSAAPEVRRRARQLAGLLAPGLRPELGLYFTAYRQEVRDRGITPVRPMPYQFPNDPEAARHSGQFMLGDELLAAPVAAPGGRHSVYLPAGTWTPLDGGEVYRGRQTVELDGAEPALLARAGSIVPIERGGVVELHYFPRLAGEFFLYEPDQSGEFSQIHAAPAGDIMRLQIESVRDREYCWVVRNVDRPAAVGFEGRNYAEAAPGAALRPVTWRYEPRRRSLHIRVRVTSGEDRIINVTWP